MQGLAAFLKVSFADLNYASASACCKFPAALAGYVNMEIRRVSF